MSVEQLRRAKEARYQRRRRAAIRAGTWDHPVDGQLVRDHVAGLRDRYRMSVPAVATAAGVSTAAVTAIVHPTPAHPSKTVYPPTARAILAVTSPLSATGGSYIGATGTRRRLQALIRGGWSRHEVAARLGVSLRSVRNYLQTDTVTARTARRVAALYDDLADWPGPDPAVAAWAAEHRYAPPWAWADVDIDDRHAKPNLRIRRRPEPAPDRTAIDEVAVQRAISGGNGPVALTPAERLLAVQTLAARGLSDTEIAIRCAVAPETVLRDRTEHAIQSRWTA